MLMRRARAYSNSCSQVVLVYLYPFRCNSRFWSEKSSKIMNPFLGFNVIQGHRMTFLRSLSPVLVMISSMSVAICNHYHARQTNSG